MAYCKGDGSEPKFPHQKMAITGTSTPKGKFKEQKNATRVWEVPGELNSEIPRNAQECPGHTKQRATS